MLLVARAINGVGRPSCFPAAFASAGDLPDPAARGRALALLSSAFPLSNLLGLPIGALATSIGGWRAPFALIAVLAVVAMVGVATSAARLDGDERRFAGTRATFGRVLRDRQALAVMSVTLVWFTGAIGMFIYVGEFIHTTFGMPEEQAGLAYLVVGCGRGGRGAFEWPRHRPHRRATDRPGRDRASSGHPCSLLPLTTVALPLTLAVFCDLGVRDWFGVPGCRRSWRDCRTRPAGRCWHSTAVP